MSFFYDDIFEFFVCKIYDIFMIRFLIWRRRVDEKVGVVLFCEFWVWFFGVIWLIFFMSCGGFEFVLVLFK